MHKKYPSVCDERFPHYTYGTKKSSDTYKKSFPSSFKRYFFKTLKSFVKTERGVKRLKNAPPTFMVAGGKRCTIHEVGCPDDCYYATQNKKVLLRATLMKRRQKEPGTYRSRVWRRRDQREALKKILMLNSEIEHCTFEPEAGSMNKNIDLVIRANPNL